MKRVLFSVMSGIVVLVLGYTDVWAQATAQVSGTARDQSGAVLPGVEIRATQTETGITRTTITNESGSYVLPNLPIGPYKLEGGRYRASGRTPNQGSSCRSQVLP